MGDRDISEGVLTFAYLALCNVFVTMPLLVAPLLRRFALVCTLLALAFVTLVTVGENSALVFIERAPNNTQLIVWQRMYWATNYFQAMWVLLALGTLRLGGYRLAAAKTTDLTASIAQNKADPS